MNISYDKLCFIGYYFYEMTLLYLRNRPLDSLALA